MLSGVQTGDGTSHGIYNIRGIANARTNRKDDIFVQRRLGQIFICILKWGQRIQGNLRCSSLTQLNLYMMVMVKLDTVE